MSGERTEVEINSVITAIIVFIEFPEIAHKSVGQIIQTEENIAGGCLMLTSDNCMEAITILNFIGGIDTADVSIEYVLRNHQQAGTCNKFAILQPCSGLTQNKAASIIITTRAIEIPITTKPSC